MKKFPDNKIELELEDRLSLGTLRDLGFERKFWSIYDSKSVEVYFSQKRQELVLVELTINPITYTIKYLQDFKLRYCETCQQWDVTA